MNEPYSLRSEQRKEDQDATARTYSTGVNGNEPTGGSEVADRRKSLFAPGDTLRIAVSLIDVGPPRHANLLKDLFWTLYSKLAAVLESHRVIYEVARWISSVSLFLRCGSVANDA